MVTAIEGKPSRVIRTPLRAPPRTPMTSTATMANPMGHPCLNNSPSMVLDSPSIDATDRSISPVMMINVRGNAMMAISPMFKPV